MSELETTMTHEELIADGWLRLSRDGYVYIKSE